MDTQHRLYIHKHRPFARAQETAVAGESGDGEAALPMLSVVNTMLMRKTEVGHICFRRMLGFRVLPF